MLQLLTIEFQLPGCRSLKEKRQRIGGFRDRCGRSIAIGAAETGLQDVHERSAWEVAIVGSSRQVIDGLAEDVLRAAERVDGWIQTFERHWIE